MDARRTPDIIEDGAAHGHFRWRITKFEDEGAYWDVPLEDVVRFQFALDATELPDERTALLTATLETVDRILTVPVDPRQQNKTELQISEIAASLENYVSASVPAIRSKVPIDELAAEICDRFAALLRNHMEAQGLGEQEHLTSKLYVLNPYSGEWVKGMQIVCAEIGLRQYSGKMPRTADIFSGIGDKSSRRSYLIHRFAFVRALFRLLGYEEVTLFRGMAAEGTWQKQPPRFFSSWTFSREVAEEFSSGKGRTKHSYCLKRTFPIDKLFMTFVETGAMNKQYREREAVVLHDDVDEALW
jgi:hypothetical protein